ncbi:MAG TPA: ABC transporter permease [Bryobacteraceae bacterium]|nr:ABC transporter permease [Bryobacteraceae bacterium]
MHDLRYALRTLARRPGFTFLAVIALALGIGANTAIFSVVNATLLLPLPYRGASRLVIIWDRLARLGIDQFPVSTANYLDYKTAARSFDEMAAFWYSEFNLSTSDQSERVPAMRVTANLFPMLGISAAHGRLFLPEENQPGRDQVAVLSDSLWRRRFGASADLVGKRITLNGNALTVIGILPAGFSFSAGHPDAPEIWTPVALVANPDRSGGTLELIARMKPRVSLDQARADMMSVAHGVEERYHPYRGPHGEDAGYGISVTGLRDELYGRLRQGLLVLLAAVAFVLLIACANVANLLLARSAERRREIAVRQALGAARLRLMRQLLTESVSLSLAGGVAGLALAFWGVGLLQAILPASLPHLTEIPLDARVLSFALLVSLMTGILFGLAPAFESSRAGLSESLKESGRSTSGGARASRIRQLLVISEIALSVALVIGAGLLIKSFSRLLSVNPGFRTENVITGRISLAPDQYGDQYRVARFYRTLLERIRALPGVESASAVSQLPLSGGRGGDPFSIQGRPYDAASRTPQVANQQVIAQDYFHAIGIRLLAGRTFSEREAEPVAIVNQTMARGFWPKADPIGQHILLGAPRPGAAWLTIVGVVGDVRTSGLDVAPLPQMYVPLAQSPTRSMSLVIRTSDEGVMSAVRREVFSLDPSQPFYDVKTIEQRLAATVAQPRFQSVLLGIFAALALVLAAVGVYGVVAQSVAHRTHEIGIRMALGARPSSVLRLILGEGSAMAAVGIAVGFAGMLALGRIFSSLLYEVTPFDPGIFAGAAVLLFAVVFAACYIPARSASRVDPMIALRCE